MIFDKENLLKTFGDLPGIIETYFKNIPEDVLDIKRSETAWTIREHLYHVVSNQEMLYGRMEKLKNEEKPVITPYFPENEADMGFAFKSPEEAFTHYKEMRKKQIVLINQLTEYELSKDAEHGEYIRYNIPIIINHMIFHEYWHMYRIEEIWLTKDEYFS